MIKVWILVITDNQYMEVQLFYGEDPPIPEQMLAKIDFSETDHIKQVLDQLRSRLAAKAKNQECVTANYDDNGKKYLLRLQCDYPEHDGFVIMER